MKTFIFGEAMLEYHSRGGSGLRVGGDTLNTAIHMSRLGCDVAYVTALGTDPISDAMIAAWKSEGIDTAHVLRHPERIPGIYAIHLDEAGERSFLYWRDRSAAREMFALPGMDDALAQAEESDLVYFSLISLAVVGPSGRDRLFDLVSRRATAGRHVAFDSNFRAALWNEAEDARQVSSRFMQRCSIGLPTNDDERAIWESAERDEEIARRWRDAGCETVVVKAGKNGCVAVSGTGEITRFPSLDAPVVDSSGAGDAFNAGFLANWLPRERLDEAIAAGQALAASTIGHLGAVRPR